MQNLEIFLGLLAEKLNIQIKDKTTYFITFYYFLGPITG